MSARKSKVVKVNISAGTYKDEAEAVREANAIKRWLIRYCDKNGYSIKGKVWISTNSAYAGTVIIKGRKKEYKPNGKPLPTVVEAHIHMVLFCNPASTIVDALKSYLNKKHMKAVVWDRHCNSRAEVENAVEYAMRQSRKVRTIDYDRKDVLSVDEWGYYEAVEKAEAKIKDNMAFTKSEPEQTPETLENKSVSSISDTPETLTYKSIKYNYLYYYIVPTSYNHSIIKALLQNIIYYSRESSRSSCSKIIFKKVLLKVPCLLKKMSFCVIIVMTDEESVVLVTEISNSYILLVKQNQKESSVKIAESSDNKPRTIILSTKKYEPFREYLSSCFAEIKEIYDLSSLPTYYECRFKHYKSPNVKMFVYCVRGDCYADITVSGKNKDRIIQQMELIHTTLEKSKASEQFTLITSYDSVSEYYCNKMYPLLNEVERKLRKLLYIIYTLRYRKDYIEYTFVENTLSPESKKNIEAYLKKEMGTGNREIWRQKYFEQFEYKHYKHLLFYPKWTVIDIVNKDEFLKSNPDLAKLSDEELRERFSTFTPMSDWEKHFSNKVDKDISAETLISNVQKPRNKVAHYKTITKDEYEAFLENVHKLIEVIDKAIDISVSKDFIQEGMKYLTDNMSKALESLRNTISEYVLNTFPYFFQSAKSAVGALTELFDEAEESVVDCESEDEDNA